MKQNKYVSTKKSLYIRLLYQEQKISIPDIIKKFPESSQATIYS